MISTLTIKSLTKTKTRALRHKIWFKTLSRTERAIIDLTVTCVERIHSSTLAAIVSSIVGKVLKTLESGLSQTVNRIGSAIVEDICGIAQKWGNANVLRWKHDFCFIWFLGISAVNTSNQRGKI